jgi:hypothetical protein
LGGWSVGGVTTFQSGVPSTITCGTCINPVTFGTVNLFGLSTGTLFPQVAGNLNQLLLAGNPGQFTDKSVFNPAVLAAPPIYGPVPPGNGTTSVSGLNTLGGPGDQTFTIGGQGTGAPVGEFFGNLGRNISQARGPRQQLWDFYITKSFPFREKYSIQFRSELFNLFNHTNFQISNLSLGSPAFGIYDTQAGSSRVVQFALKLQF